MPNTPKKPRKRGGRTRKPQRRSRGKSSKRPRPAIDADEQNLRVSTEEAWKALRQANKPPVLYRRLGAIVRVEKGDDGKPILQTVTQDRMRHRLSEVAEWHKLTQKGRQPAKPPVDVVKNVLATPDPNLPVLEAIVEVPVFGADGAILTSTGYHPNPRTLYLPPSGFTLPRLPDRRGS